MNNENALISPDFEPVSAGSADYELIVKKPEKSVYKRKYGVIRIANEKELRKITYEELKSLSDPKKLADTNVVVSIPSQKIKLPLSKIVFQEAREEITEEFEEFSKLPVKTIILNNDFTISTKSPNEYIKTREPFIMATVHMDGETPILEPKEKIQTLLYMVPDDSPYYPHIVARIIRYGESIH